MKLRVHHLLCVPLYCGHGYSDAFVKNMDQKAAELKRGCRVCLQTDPDEICASCPNLVQKAGEAARCSLDRNHVQTKDERLLTALQLEAGREYDSMQLWKAVRDRMTQEIFEGSCGRCEWYRQGLCSYEKYIAAVDALK